MEQKVELERAGKEGEHAGASSWADNIGLWLGAALLGEHPAL